jgi:hypothetical protein
MRRLNEIMKDCESYKLEFKESKYLSGNLINKSMIGEILYKNVKKLDDSSIRMRLNTTYYETFGLNVKPYFLCVLPNGLLATVNRNEKNITIYDWKFYLVKTIDKIDDKTFSPYEMSVGEENTIYILDRVAHQIIMTDFEFNKLKTFGSHGNDMLKFNVPYSICYRNNFLYVSDRINKRIQVLTENLVFCKSVELSYKPRYICVSDKMACVKNNEESETYFYDIDTFMFKFKYSRGLGRISAIGENFYEICVANRKIYCYKSDGGLDEEVCLNKRSSFISNSWNGHIVSYNGNLVMSCSSQKLVLKF